MALSSDRENLREHYEGGGEDSHGYAQKERERRGAVAITTRTFSENFALGGLGLELG